MEQPQSLGETEYIKHILPQHLHQFAHLIPLVVNKHVSWMEPERKRYAITVGLAAFDKALTKRRAGSTDAEFGEYAKQCIRGAVLNEFTSDIGERQFGRSTPQGRTQHVSYDEDSLEVQQHWVGDFYAPSDGDWDEIVPDDYDEDPFEEGDGEELTPALRPGVSLHTGDSLCITGECDDEYARMAEGLVILEEAGDPMGLLPGRERGLLRRIEQGATVTQVAEEEGISKARVSQVVKQARERLACYKTRIWEGEAFVALLDESRRAAELSAKKQGKHGQTTTQGDPLTN